ncbi:MAG: peptidylprolyl isomerase [Prevotellaceae bacterium]|jgi:peptidyl-prolyl cis-trans isomerase SurA|nr:peptidylprolyl isomerase [Prevotellaceae bacterium]
MIKKSVAIIIFSLTLLSVHAQGSLDKVVGVVGNEAILESDIEMLYKDMQIQGMLSEKNPRCEILSMMIDQKLLVAQAKQDSLVPNLDNIHNEVERKIAATIAQTGGNREMVESYYNKTIEQLREESIALETEQMYAQAMTREIGMKVKTTPNEVYKFFKSIDKDSLPVVPDQFMLYEIVKKPNSEQAVIAAKEKLLNLRKRIIDGERFQTLASLYTEDEVTAIRGGEVGLTPLEGSVPPVRMALLSMRVGQISKIVESEYGFHILQLLTRQENNGVIQVNYRHILIRPRYTLEDRKAGFAALDSIVNKIKADSVSFNTAAMYFSDNEQTRINQGLMVFFDRRTLENRPYFYKDELNPDDFRAIEHIGVGEMSEPYKAMVSGSEVYKVVLLKEFIPSHTVNFKDDFGFISGMYENKKRMEALREWVAKQVKTEYIRIDRKYENCPVVNREWLFN